MSNLTHLQGRITKVKFMSRLLEQIYVESETNWKVGSESEKNHSRSTTLVTFSDFAITLGLELGLRIPVSSFQRNMRINKIPTLYSNESISFFLPGSRFRVSYFEFILFPLFQMISWRKKFFYKIFKQDANFASAMSSSSLGCEALKGFLTLSFRPEDIKIQ